MKQLKMKQEIRQYFWVITGGILFAAAVNLFIVPLNLYSCGVVGIAQVLRTILVDYMHIPFPHQIDIAGILNFLINIPLFVLAYRSISHSFFVKTLVNVIVQTAALTFIMVPNTPIIEDVLTSCVVAGVIGGFGIGMVLRSSGSGGGLDILGVYMTKKSEKFSVGKLSLIINVIVYLFCAVLFNVQTAVYSIIFMISFSLMPDKMHFQNINMTAMIFTKNKEIQKVIMKEMGRGVTYWKGAGAYTNTDTYILLTVINKYEEDQIRRIVEAQDPHAFVILSEGMRVSGNFERRL